MADNELFGMDELIRFLQEHPDAKVQSIERVSTNNVTGEETRSTIYQNKDNQPKNQPSKPKKPSQPVLSEFEQDILAWLEPGVLYTAQNVCEDLPSIRDAGISPARVSSMMQRLAQKGLLKSTVEKRKVFYELA